jgi:hypothetical protein
VAPLFFALQQRARAAARLGTGLAVRGGVAARSRVIGRRRRRLNAQRALAPVSPVAPASAAAPDASRGARRGPVRAGPPASPLSVRVQLCGELPDLSVQPGGPRLGRLGARLGSTESGRSAGAMIPWPT